MLARKPASRPTPTSSARWTCRSRLPRAPTARMIANSRARSSRVAVTAANSTTTPAASVKPKRNSTARITLSRTPCTCVMVAVMSTLVTLGKARTSALSKPACSGARNAPMKVTGMSGSALTGYITKKFACMELQSTLRSDVIFASLAVPATSKRSVSPSLRPSVSARPASTLTAPCSPGVQRPATTWLCAGCCAAYERLNSRSTRRRARSSGKSSGPIPRPFTATRRPRNMGYQSSR